MKTNIKKPGTAILSTIDNASAVRDHIDFALEWNEVELCAVCGEVPWGSSVTGGPWKDYMTVTPGGAHPIGGLIGVCSSCGHGRYRKRTIISKWRKTAPPLIQILPGVPVQLVVRGCCDDAALAQVIRDTFDKVPRRSRQKIMDYVLSDDHYSLTGTGMRFEALGRWPGMCNFVGMNMDRGHAIRLRASYVKDAGIKSLVEVIAHELAHTEQNAEQLRFESSDHCERDVEARIRKWGFDAGTAKYQKQRLLSQFDLLIKNTKQLKTEIQSSARIPSGNFANAAFSAIAKAQNAIFRSRERWHGRGWD